MSLHVLHNWKRKLTPHDIGLIKQLKREGLTGVQIAEKFEIHPSHVSRILNGRVWTRFDESKIPIRERDYE